MVLYRGDVTYEQAREDFSSWALDNGWTVLTEAESWGVGGDFFGKVYPLKINIGDNPDGEGMEIRVFLPPPGEKRY